MSELEKSLLDASGITNVREFEQFLRSAGFTKSRAKALASRGWATTETQSEPVALKRAMEMLAEAEREDFWNE